MDIYGKLILIVTAVLLPFIPIPKATAYDGGDGDDGLHVPAIDGIYSDCRMDNECQATQTCYKKKCINVCHLPKRLSKLQCSYAAVCYISEPHTAGCQCLTGFTGDPYETGCEQIRNWGQ